MPTSFYRPALLLLTVLLSACNENNNDSCSVGQVLKNGLCVSHPLSVSGLSPQVMTVDAKTKVTVLGRDLPPAVMFSIQDGVCDAPVERSATAVTQWCAVSSAGRKNVTVRYQDGAEAGKRVLSMGVNPDLGVLNDTGLQLCDNNIQESEDEFLDMVDCSGMRGLWRGLQDAEYGRDARAASGHLFKTGGGVGGFDFTKISSRGKPLPANAEDWACVLDNHSGLMWEVKTYDGGIQDVNRTYSWYNPDSATNGGDPGRENDGANTLAYVNAINARTLCGQGDWRLPTRTELHGIMVYGKNEVGDLAIDTDYFTYSVPREVMQYYWTSTTFAADPVRAWTVALGGGYDGRTSKYATFYVRVVRSAR